MPGVKGEGAKLKAATGEKTLANWKPSRKGVSQGPILKRTVSAETGGIAGDVKIGKGWAISSYDHKTNQQGEIVDHARGLNR